MIVDNNCDKFPKIVTRTALILSAFSKQKTRPPNSPTLLGVKIETVIPRNTALIASQKVTFSSLEIKYCHFKASIDQLININNRTSAKRLLLSLFKSAKNCCSTSKILSFKKVYHTKTIELKTRW